jgi:hypothetical protein
MAASPAFLPQSYAAAIASYDGQLQFLARLGHEPGSRENASVQLAIALAGARSIAAGVTSILGTGVLADVERQQLEDLLERADDVVDTLRWSLEAPDALRAAADRECR